MDRIKAAFWCAASHTDKVLHSRYATVFILLYAAVKFLSNRLQNASLATSLRVPLISLLLYGLGMFVIEMMYCYWRPRPAPETGPGASRPASLAVIGLVWIFWAASIVDGLQAAGKMPGTPILAWLPGWHALRGGTLTASQNLSPHLLLQPYQVQNVLLHLGLQVALPMIVLLLLGYRWRDFRLTFRNARIAAPFLVLLGAAFVAGGLSTRRFALLGYGLLYPALVEEFLYRGLMQTTLGRWIKPAAALAVAVLMFTLLHAPDYYFRIYAQDVWLMLGGMADVAIAGVLIGVGFQRTQSVLPWAAFHALYNLTPF